MALTTSWGAGCPAGQHSPAPPYRVARSGRVSVPSGDLPVRSAPTPDGVDRARTTPTAARSRADATSPPACG
eukprot:ctg_392.g242